MRVHWVPRWGFNHSLHELVRALPLRSLLPLGLAIGSLFAVLGPVMDLSKGGRLGAAMVVQITVFSGLIAIGYAFASMRRNYWWLAALIVISVLWYLLVPRGYLGTYPHLPAEFTGK